MHPISGTRGAHLPRRRKKGPSLSKQFSESTGWTICSPSQRRAPVAPAALRALASARRVLEKHPPLVGGVRPPGMAAYRVVLTPAADRQLGKLPPQAREMIAAALVVLRRNPRPPGCTKLAGGDDLWRIRIRQYRVIYQILENELIVTVVKIGDRKDVYR